MVGQSRPRTAPAGGRRPVISASEASTSDKYDPASEVKAPAQKKPLKYKTFNSQLTPGHKAKRIRNVSVDLPKHLASGVLQANLVPFKPDELIELVDGIMDGCESLQHLRLLCVSKGYSPSNEENKKYATKTHERCVEQVVSKMQAERLRRRMPKLLRACLKQAPLKELELGFTCAGENAKALAKGLLGNRTIRKLSFAGSNIGDTNFLTVYQVLKTMYALEELAVPYCKLTDASGKAIAGLIKGNASRSATEVWQSQLRTYRPQSPRKGYDHSVIERDHQTFLESNDGLVALNICGNKMTYKTAHALCNALQHDAKMVSLDLSHNRISKEAFVEMSKIMKDHGTLEEIDLSHNVDKMGTLTKEDGDAIDAEEGAEGEGEGEGETDARDSEHPVRIEHEEAAGPAIPHPSSRSAGGGGRHDPTTALAEKALKQLFEYESRIAVLEKQRLQDLKKIRKLSKENEQLQEQNEKLSTRKNPPTISRAPKKKRPESAHAPSPAPSASTPKPTKKPANEHELIGNLSEALLGIERIVNTLADKRQQKDVEDIKDPSLLKSALLVEDLNKQLISLCDLG